MTDSGSFYVIGLGINDLSYFNNLTMFLADYQNLLTYYIQSGIPPCRIILMGITYSSNPGGSLSGIGFYTAARAQQWETAIGQLAAANGCQFVPVFNLWNASTASTYLQADGIHPNPAGHKLMAANLLSVLQNVPFATIPSYVPEVQ